MTERRHENPHEFAGIIAVLQAELSEIIDSTKFGYDIEIDNHVIEVILFPTESADIESRQRLYELIDLLAEFIQKHEKIPMRVEVCGDTRGSYYLRLHKR